MSTAARADPRFRVRIDDDWRPLPITTECWHAAAARGDTRTVFQEPAWQRCWWDSYGRGRLLIASAWSHHELVAIAPLFIDGGMAFFVGSGGSDYLDFIGDVVTPGLLDSMLEAIAGHVPGLLGFRFYHVPDASRTGHALQLAAARMDLACFDEGELAAPMLDLRSDPSAGIEAANRASLRRHERWYRRNGALSVRHCVRAAEILPQLDAFFDQHRRRWQATEHPSLFDDPAHRAFYRRLADCADSGWLRFTTIAFGGNPVAFHFGFSHRGVFLWYKPSFEIDQAQHSPGEVLLRQLFLSAVDEQALVFDFGLGDEAFKHRFASSVPTVRTWGLYRKT